MTLPMGSERLRLSRRRLIKTGAGALVAMSAAGCSFFRTEAVQKGTSDQGEGDKPKQAPSLRERVASGELPKLSERLPENPMVVEPLEELGRYGGTWTSAMVTQEDSPWLSLTMGYEPLIRWRPEWTNALDNSEMVPNIAEEFSVNDDGTEFTFKLRRGLRWSDGEPCTVEDMEFTWFDYNVDADFHPYGIYDLWLSADGEPANFEQIGEDEVRFTFSSPKPSFLRQICANASMILPKHYLTQFHPKYNDDVETLVEEAGLEDWLQLLDERRQWHLNADCPVLNPWVIEDAVGEDGSFVTANRNPYYWKVDPDGSQLPYIDRYVCEILLDVEVEVLKIQNGELDFQMRNFATVQNRPVLARAREDGDFRFVELSPNGVNTCAISLNQTHPDRAKAKVFSNLDFRIGLSHAINRQRIIDAVFGGQGEPNQCAPLPDDPVYHSELATQYLEYDVDLANEYLDEAGYAEKNGDGIRLDDDGNPIKIVILVVASMPDQVDTLDLVGQDWRAVGVDSVLQPVQEILYWERVEAGQVECSSWTGGGFSTNGGRGDNHYYIPTNPRGGSRYGRKWSQWFSSNGEEGTRPPDDLVRALELHDKMRETYDTDEVQAMAQEVLEISKDWFFYIGISTPPGEYGVVSNAMRNVPEEMPGHGAFMGPGPTNPEQYFFVGK